MWELMSVSLLQPDLKGRDTLRVMVTERGVGQN